MHELSVTECAAVLERTSLGRLGYTEGSQPFIVPTYFAFDREANSLYAFSSVGRKIRAMGVNPRVCLEVEDILAEDHWTTVLVVGRFREIRRHARDAERRDRAEAFLQRRPGWWIPGVAKVGTQQRDRTVTYEIAIDRVTGRRTARGGRATADQAAIA